MAKTTVNFSLISDDALEGFNACQKAICALALAENDLIAVNDKLKKKYPASEVKDHNTRERNAVAAAKERANGICSMTVSRFISTADYLDGNLYHFNMTSFLQNIGVLVGDPDDAKKSHIKKIESFRNVVVDRVRNGLTQRKKGDTVLTTKADKLVRNTPVELVLGIIEGLVASGCIDYSKGGLVRVDFTKEA